MSSVFKREGGAAHVLLVIIAPQPLREAMSLRTRMLLEEEARQLVSACSERFRFIGERHGSKTLPSREHQGTSSSRMRGGPACHGDRRTERSRKVDASLRAAYATGCRVRRGHCAPDLPAAHRAIRSQQVRRRWLGLFRPLLEIFSGTDVSGFEGLNIQFPARTPGNVDEAGSTIKYTLGRLENRRQTILATLVDEHRLSGSAIDAAKLPDIYDSLATLTSTLLPHLSFQRIDFSNEESIQCVFQRADVVGTDDLDLDDISSGEKAILLLFLPLVENEITRLLNALERGGAAGAPIEPAPDRVFLIDEPEQHLHPDLQGRILGYLRDEAARQNTQFIITTHSPTLVDQAFDSELYVLGFSEKPDENQLRRVATSADRLETIRARAGNTYVITTGRSIVCVEGTGDSSTKPTDVRLLEILCPTATRYTFVPVGGKGNVIRVVQQLRENLSEEHFGISVFGIVDRDRSQTSVEGVAAWDVATIENLLLDAGAIAAVTNDLRDEADATPERVASLLVETSRVQREEEIALRVMEAIGVRTVRIKGISVEEVKAATPRSLTIASATRLPDGAPISRPSVLWLTLSSADWKQAARCHQLERLNGVDGLERACGVKVDGEPGPELAETEDRA